MITTKKQPYLSADVCCAEPEKVQDVKQRLLSKHETKYPLTENKLDFADTETSPALDSTELFNTSDSNEQLAQSQASVSYLLNLSENSANGIRQTKRTDTYEETYEENESGLSWGRKQAHDHHWEERWLQQKLNKKKSIEDSDAEESVQVQFGRSEGVNYQLCQRWISSWETHVESQSTIQKVNKIISRSKPEKEQDTVEEWTESILIETPNYLGTEDVEVPIKKQTVEKKGFDRELQKHWMEATTEVHYPKPAETFDSIAAETSCLRLKDTDARTINQNDSAVYIDQYVTEYYPIESLEIKRHYTKETNGKSTLFHTREKKAAKEKSETQLESQTTFNTISESEEKTIHPHTKTIKKETIKKICQDNKPESVERQIMFEDGSSSKTTTEYQPDGTIYTAMKKVVMTERQNEKKATSTESCWKKTNGDTWGDSETQEFAENCLLTKQVNRKWYDNTKEKFEEEWVTEYQYDENGQMILKKEYGYKHGDRYSDGTEWGDRWCKTYKITSKEDSTETSTELILSSEEKDQWWKETSGNRWGEKKSQNFENNTKETEEWYDNGNEKQVDRWRIDENGQRSGEKFGQSREKNCEWNEKWKGTENSNNFWIDKYWTEYKDQQLFKWGEIKGRKNQRQWKENWNEDKIVDRDIGSRSVTKWVDDGLGNVETRKEGYAWNEGMTTNWYLDSYGECLENSEKWAYKQGGNDNGDVWMEKWNETPLEKSAEKQGSNSQGDQWREAWKESYSNGSSKKWAEKTGKNNQGEEWSESWWEDEFNKTAKKIGKNFHEHWQEEWGEHMQPDGSGEKWTSKWTRAHGSNDARGQNWGDKWGPSGKHGHHWDEKWVNDNKISYAYDTEGRPEGC